MRKVEVCGNCGQPLHGLVERSRRGLGEIQCAGCGSIVPLYELPRFSEASATWKLKLLLSQATELLGACGLLVGTYFAFKAGSPGLGVVIGILGLGGIYYVYNDLNPKRTALDLLGHSREVIAWNLNVAVGSRVWLRVEGENPVITRTLGPARTSRGIDVLEVEMVRGDVRLADVTVDP